MKADYEVFEGNDHVDISADNIDVIRDRVSASDLKGEVQVGRRVSHFALRYEGGQRGDVLVLHDRGRGAIMLGAESEWGDWDENSWTLTLDADGSVLHVGYTGVYEDEDEDEENI